MAETDLSDAIQKIVQKSDGLNESSDTSLATRNVFTGIFSIYFVSSSFLFFNRDILFCSKVCQRNVFFNFERFAST